MANSKSSRNNREKKTNDPRAHYLLSGVHHADISVYDRNFDRSNLEIPCNDIVPDGLQIKESCNVPFLSAHIPYPQPTSHSMCDIVPCHRDQGTISKTEVIAVVHEILTAMRGQREQLERMTDGQSLTHFHHISPVCRPKSHETFTRGSLTQK